MPRPHLALPAAPLPSVCLVSLFSCVTYVPSSGKDALVCVVHRCISNTQVSTHLEEMLKKYWLDELSKENWPP